MRRGVSYKFQAGSLGLAVLALRLYVRCVYGYQALAARLVAEAVREHAGSVPHCGSAKLVE